jgi:hypothetical protein
MKQFLTLHTVDGKLISLVASSIFGLKDLGDKKTELYIVGFSITITATTSYFNITKKLTEMNLFSAIRF